MAARRPDQKRARSPSLKGLTTQPAKLLKSGPSEDVKSSKPQDERLQAKSENPNSDPGEDVQEGEITKGVQKPKDPVTTATVPDNPSVTVAQSAPLTHPLPKKPSQVAPAPVTLDSKSAPAHLATMAKTNAMQAPPVDRENYIARLQAARSKPTVAAKATSIKEVSQAGASRTTTDGPENGATADVPENVTVPVAAAAVPDNPTDPEASFDPLMCDKYPKVEEWDKKKGIVIRYRPLEVTSDSSAASRVGTTVLKVGDKFYSRKARYAIVAAGSSSEDLVVMDIGSRRNTGPTGLRKELLPHCVAIRSPETRLLVNNSSYTPLIVISTHWTPQQTSMVFPYKFGTVQTDENVRLVGHLDRYSTIFIDKMWKVISLERIPRRALISVEEQNYVTGVIRAISVAAEEQLQDEDEERRLREERARQDRTRAYQAGAARVRGGNRQPRGQATVQNIYSNIPYNRIDRRNEDNDVQRRVSRDTVQQGVPAQRDGTPRYHGNTRGNYQGNNYNPAYQQQQYRGNGNGGARGR